MPDQMQRIVLAKRPEGQPTPENFRLETVAMPSPGEGEVLLRVLYMSLDPYMRGRMDDAKSYSTPVAIDEQMGGGAVGEVLESRSSRFKPGDIAMGMFGWGSHGVVAANELRKIDAGVAPVSTSLGVLGMPAELTNAPMRSRNSVLMPVSITVPQATSRRCASRSLRPARTGSTSISKTSPG